MMSEIKWVMFTKRTEDPKLNWLECQLSAAEIPHRRNGESWHAPILEVLEPDLKRAWSILTPVDDIPDDDAQFVCEKDDWESEAAAADYEGSLEYFNRYIAGDR